MSRDFPSGSNRLRPLSPMTGTNAALQLLPVPTFMVDEDGLLVGSNEPFETMLGVSVAMLNGRHWSQGFAGQSSISGIAMLTRVVRSEQPRGEEFVEMVRTDSRPLALTLRWLRVTEPSTHRPLWIYAVTDDGASGTSRRTSQTGASTGEVAAVTAQKLRDALTGDAERLTTQVRDVIDGLQQVVKDEAPPTTASMSGLLRRALGPKLADRSLPMKVSGAVSAVVRSEGGDPARALALMVDAATQSMATIVPLFIEVSELEADVQVLIRPIRKNLTASAEKIQSRIQLAEAIVAACGGFVEWRDADASVLLLFARADA